MLRNIGKQGSRRRRRYDGTLNGSYDYDAYILKFGNTGIREWATYHGGSDYHYGYAVSTSPKGKAFVTGSVTSTDFPTYDPGGAYYQGAIGGDYDAFLLKFQQASAVGVAESGEEAGRRVWIAPSIFQDHLGLRFAGEVLGEVEVRLYDAVGRLVMERKVRTGGSYEWKDSRLRELPAGVYVVEVETETGRERVPVVKMR